MLTKLIGKHYIDMAKAWSKTGVTLGATAGLAFLFVTDWKLIAQYIPIYNTKFKEDE
uniref:Cytochrome b-c1 complex subunit 10 n=1 Tax=Latrodectus hesperus TaxID=256737 RepID=E7D1Z2_LATHE|nr:hypothetical protein [Latrodectus hesperus]